MAYTTNSNYSIIRDKDCLMRNTNSKEEAFAHARLYSIVHYGYYTIIDNNEGEVVAVFKNGEQIV